MQLANPIWLWGLTGLLIPIAIHLLSRKEGKVIKFGSLRYLEESQTKQSINMRLNEVVLLIIRCALIFLIVMLLCGLSINLFDSQKDQWIILEQGLEKDPDVDTLIDSLKENGFEVKSMTKGFPDLPAQDAKPFANYWEMVHQIPLPSLNKVVIVSYNFTSKFRGKRIPLPQNVTWISKEPEEKEFTLSRVKLPADSVLVRTGKSSSLQTSYINLTAFNSSNSPGNEVPLVSPDTVHIQIYAEDEFDYDRKIITASLHAIEQVTLVIFKVTLSPSAQPADWIFWLSNTGPEEVTKNTNSLIFHEDRTRRAPLLTNVTSSGDRKEWLITKRLNEETALQEQLTLNLTSLLLKNDLAKSRADSLDQTTQPERSLWSQYSSDSSFASIRLDDEQTRLFVLVAIIVMLVAERFVAFKRNA